MRNLLFILVATAGMIAAFQVALIGGITRSRGPFEATWISMLASLAGTGMLLFALSLLGRKLELLPMMFTWAFASVAQLMTTCLIVAGRALPVFYLLTGLTSNSYLLAASWASPRFGLAVLFAAIVSGQLIWIAYARSRWRLRSRLTTDRSPTDSWDRRHARRRDSH